MDEGTEPATQYSVEILSLANEFNALGGTFFAIYLTILSGYLAVAYLVGAKLTKSQLTLINVIFVLSSTYFLWSTMSMWLAGLSAYEMGAPDSWGVNRYLASIFNVVLSIAMLVGIFAGIFFMKGVRDKEKDGSE